MSRLIIALHHAELLPEITRQELEQLVLCLQTQVPKLLTEAHTLAVVDLSDGSNVALLDAANVFTDANTFTGAITFSTGLTVNDLAGKGVTITPGSFELYNDVAPTFKVGTNVLSYIALTSGAVLFPGTQIPSTDPNALDDYEEGTFTPIDASGAALAFTNAEGHYIKVGQWCHCLIYLTYPATASGAAAKIGGLPFTAKTTTNAPAGSATDTYPHVGGAAAVYRLVRSNTTLFDNYLASGVAYTNLQFTATTHYLSVMYRTAT